MSPSKQLLQVLNGKSPNIQTVGVGVGVGGAKSSQLLPWLWEMMGRIHLLLTVIPESLPRHLAAAGTHQGVEGRAEAAMRPTKLKGKGNTRTLHPLGMALRASCTHNSLLAQTEEICSIYSGFLCSFLPLR